MFARQETRPLKARRYLPQSLGVEGFFRTLRDRGANYVVLRWFEALPTMEAGEDLDLLVSDEHLPLLADLLTGVKGKDIPCDLYTASGLPGTDFRGVPYFLPSAAAEILAGARLQNDLVRVPGPREHFLSMAFHAVYHKGLTSGIPTVGDAPLPEGTFEHSYRDIVPVLGKAAGFALSSWDLTSIETVLGEQGWRPKNDTLEKWSGKNVWLRERLRALRPVLEPFWEGLTIFIIREEGLGRLDEIKAILWSEGFDLLEERALDPHRRAEVAAEIRGGNWGKGPNPKSGGLPAYAIAAYDVFPLPPGEKLAALHPGLSNARNDKTKTLVRNEVNRGRAPDQICNAVHSSDNPWQALEYAQVTMPEAVAGFGAKATPLLEAFKTPYPVLENLSSRSRRAKVELVNFHGKEAICKTFRPGREEYLQREWKARQIAGAESLIAPILESGPLHIVIEKFGPRPASTNSPFPLFSKEKFLHPAQFQSIARLLQCLRSAGYEILDFRPDSWYFDSQGLPKVIDMEFLTFTGIPVQTLRGCLAWYPLPTDFQDKRPLNKSQAVDPYGREWLEFLGFGRRAAVSRAPVGVLLAFQCWWALLLRLEKIFGPPFWFAVRFPGRVVNKLRRMWKARR